MESIPPSFLDPADAEPSSAMAIGTAPLLHAAPAMIALELDRDSSMVMIVFVFVTLDPTS
jgi:hypothetical protein